LRKIAVQLAQAWKAILAEIVSKDDHNAGNRQRRKVWKGLLGEVFITKESMQWLRVNVGEGIVLPG
jgi:hypothetical protein